MDAVRAGAVALLAMTLALTACAPVPSPTGTGAPLPLAPSTSAAAAPPPHTNPPIAAATPSVPETEPPTRVQVAAAGIDMQVVPVGVVDGGFMELPVDPSIAGWYRFGPTPWSADGNTVISAHVDAPQYPIGPFDRLRGLATGTEIVVTGAEGQTSVYGVVSVTYYPKKDLPVDEIFARTGTRMLALITCGGDFDRTTGRYADNVVVVAEPRR